MFNLNIHYMRGITIVFVVANHVIGTFSCQNNSLLCSSLTLLFYDCTIWFILIAGYLFSLTSRPTTYTSFIFRKLRRVAAPYLFSSIPAILWILSGGRMESIPQNIKMLGWPHEVIMFYLTGMHLGSYWFIPMILSIFLISPILQQIRKHQRLYITIAPLMLITLSLIHI